MTDQQQPAPWTRRMWERRRRERMNAKQRLTESRRRTLTMEDDYRIKHGGIRVDECNTAGQVAQAGPGYAPVRLDPADWHAAVKALEIVYNLILPTPRNLTDWARHLVEQNKSLAEAAQKLEAEKGGDYKRGYYDGRGELIEQINRSGKYGSPQGKLL